MSSTSSEKTFLFATVGTLGDIFPFLAIARELAREGHRCIVAAGRMHRRTIEGGGSLFLEIGPDLANYEEVPEWVRMATHRRRSSEFIIRRMILPYLRQTYDDLDPAVKDADCVVSHPLCYAAKLAAERHGVPLVVAALQPSIFFSSYDPPVVARTPTRGAVRVLGRPFYAMVFRLVRMVMRGWAEPIRQFRRELGLPTHRVDALVEGQYSPQLNLALFSPLLARPDPDWPPATVQTGFVFHDRVEEYAELPSSGRPDEELESFLESGPPPVVFTLGSLAVMNPGRFFSESVDAVRRLGVRAVLLTAPGEPRGLSVGGSVFTAGYVPHSKLFPRAAAVVHQGGIGTTAEALRSGKPQLVVPYANDQPDNAHRVARLRVGRVVALREYRARRVASELRILLGNRGYSERAAQAAAAVGRECGAARACEALSSSVGLGEETQLRNGG